MKTELKNMVGRILLTCLTMTATVNLKPIISQQLSDFCCVAEVPVSNGIKYASSIFYSGFIQKVINTILQESTCARVSFFNKVAGLRSVAYRTPLLAVFYTGFFLCLQKTTGNHRDLRCFQGYRKRPLANGLKTLHED